MNGPVGPDSSDPLAEAVARSLTRRSFLTTTSCLALASTLPLTWPGTTAASSPDGGLADWTIDDMWGVWPRPAEAIGYGCPAREPEPLTNPVDSPWTCRL